jgi:hypothetical protein
MGECSRGKEGEGITGDPNQTRTEGDKLRQVSARRISRPACSVVRAEKEGEECSSTTHTVTTDTDKWGSTKQHSSSNSHKMMFGAVVGGCLPLTLEVALYSVPASR